MTRLGTGVLVLPMALALGGGCQRGASRPTVVLVTIDTLRADRVGAYGYSPAGTPVLDGLAREGALFVEAYTPVPYTLPAHASIHTGTLPPRHGVRDNATARLPEEAVTLAETLRSEGYETAAFVGAFPLDRRFGLAQGFDHYDDELPPQGGPFAIAERPGGEVVDHALAWLAQARRGPVFLWVHLFDPHAPYAPPEPFAANFRGRPYDGEIAYADACFGRLLAGIRRADRALVVVTADHGESLGDHGEATHGLTLYEPAVRVPLLLRWPGEIPAGIRPAARARLIDLLPTICDAAGLPIPAGCEGTSLLPPLRGGPDREERAVYFETLVPRLHYGWAPLFGWRAGRWKLVRAPREELYDLVADPSESRDLFAAEAATATRLAEQQGRAAGRSASERLGVAPRAMSEEERARFAALGYLWEGDGREDGAGRDPKDMLPLLAALDAASVAIETGDHAAARDGLDGVLRADPENRMALAYLGELEESRGDLAAAEAAYRRAVERAPRDPLAAERLGAVLCRAERYGAAAEHLAPWVEGGRASAGARGWYGIALRGLGRDGDAAPVLEAAVRDDPRHGAALHALGLLTAKAGRGADAEAWFRRAIAVVPERDGAASRMELASLLAARPGTETERRAAREESKRELAVVLRHFPRWKRALELRARVESAAR